MRNSLTILTYLLLSLTILPGCGIDCIDKKTGISKSSETMKEAQESHLYKFEFIADNPVLMLDNGLTLSIKKAWVENKWRYECVDNKAKVVKDSAFQFVIDAEYKGEPVSSKYWLGNNHLGSVLSFDYSGQEKYVLTLHKQLSDSLPGNLVAVDTISFIRRMASR